jgi:hypothetical protein
VLALRRQCQEGFQNKARAKRKRRQHHQSQIRYLRYRCKKLCSKTASYDSTTAITIDSSNIEKEVLDAVDVFRNAAVKQATIGASTCRRLAERIRQHLL